MGEGNWETPAPPKISFFKPHSTRARGECRFTLYLLPGEHRKAQKGSEPHLPCQLAFRQGGREDVLVWGADSRGWLPMGTR